MKYSAVLIAGLGLVYAAPAPAPALSAREVPQEHSHNKFLDLVRTSLNLNNPKKIQDPVFGLLGNAAAAAGAGAVTNTDCLQQETADQAFTNAKAAGDIVGMAGALLYRSIERNTGAVGKASVICNETAVNPEIAALTQHQDPASANAASINKGITLALAKQLAAIGADPLLALESGTFAPGQTTDTTGAGNSCDTNADEPGCIFSQNLLVLDATEAEISAAVQGITPTFTGTGVISATDVDFAKLPVATGATGAVAAGTTAAAAATTAATTAAASAADSVCVRSTVTMMTTVTAAAAASAADSVCVRSTVTMMTTVTAGAAAATAAAAATTGTSCSTVVTTVSASEATSLARRNLAVNPLPLARRALDFGSCADPTILFKSGLDGRTTNAFIAQDQTDFNHGSALNIAVIAGFICQRLGSPCNAPADVQASCTSASAAAVATSQDQAAADVWNSILVGGAAAAVTTAAPAAASATESSVAVTITQCS